MKSLLHLTTTLLLTTLLFSTLLLLLTTTTVLGHNKIVDSMSQDLPSSSRSHLHFHTPTSFHYFQWGAPTGLPSLFETLAEDGRFSRLVAGLALAFGDHSDILIRAAPLTVFAPMDSAFAKVDNSTLEKLLADMEALRGVLARHMVANMEVKIAEGNTTLDSLGGGSLTVTRRCLSSRNRSRLPLPISCRLENIDREMTTVAGEEDVAEVVEMDIQARDGVIHVIDTII